MYMYVQIHSFSTKPRRIFRISRFSKIGKQLAKKILARFNIMIRLKHCLLCQLLTTTLASTTTSNLSTFIFLADLHIGEGCQTSHTNYTFNDTNCYSVQDLNHTVTKINSLVGNTSLIIVGGDLTSSAQRTEFLAAKHYLDKLQSPYIATIGNHDVWSYDEAIGDRTPFPRGDLLFSEIFQDTFIRARALGRLTYPNVSVPNGRVTDSDSLLHAQSWTFRPGSTFSIGLQNLTFLAPDFNTRDRAPPPCPGSSPVGGCGVTGKADFNKVTGGSWDWFQSELQAMRERGRLSKADVLKEDQSVVYFVTHQPFRCRFGIPDWYFCFSKIMKKKFRDVVSKYLVWFKKNRVIFRTCV